MVEFLGIPSVQWNTQYKTYTQMFQWHIPEWILVIYWMARHFHVTSYCTIRAYLDHYITWECYFMNGILYRHRDAAKNTQATLQTATRGNVIIITI